VSQTQTPDNEPAIQKPDPSVPQPRSEPDTERIDPESSAPDPAPEPAPAQDQTKTGDELAAEAEIRRLRASAAPPKPRTKPRHKHRPHILLRILPWVALVIVGTIIGWLVWSVIDDGGMDDNGYTVAPPSDLDPLEQAARSLKPLDDLERNDRVWYFNHVCGFQKWDGDNHNFALVKCGANPKTLRVRTIKLVPVEQKSAVAIT
jgi:hypothetical protein